MRVENSKMNNKCITKRYDGVSISCNAFNIVCCRSYSFSSDSRKSNEAKKKIYIYICINLKKEQDNRQFSCFAINVCNVKQFVVTALIYAIQLTTYTNTIVHPLKMEEKERGRVRDTEKKNPMNRP